MNFSLWGFLGSLLLYSVVSTTLFVFSSGGWTGILITLPAAGIFYGSIWILSLIVSFVLYAAGTKGIILPWKSFWTVLVLQGLAVLLNPGDCGDVSGGGPFIFRTLLPNDVMCRSGTFYSSDFFIILGIGLLAIVALISLWTLARIYWKACPVGKKTVSGFLITLYSVVSIILIVGAGWFAWQVVGEDYRGEISYLQIDSTGSYSNCRVYSSRFSSVEEHCGYLLKKYGYSFQLDSGRYVITSRNFSFSDFVRVILK